jgi:hypothetical protein
MWYIILSIVLLLIYFLKKSKSDFFKQDRVDTGWINLVEPAKAEVQITIIESGGDGVADPQIGYLTAFFK